MKLKPKCSVDRCQLAAMPHSRKGYCRYHMVNKGIPRKRDALRDKVPVKQHLPQLLILQRNYCCICGYRFYGNQDLAVDHLHPFSLGGRNSINNLGASHALCNLVKFNCRITDECIRERVANIGRQSTDGDAFAKNILSTEQQAEVARLYATGEYTTVELGEMFHCSTSTALLTLRRQGISTSEGKWRVKAYKRQAEVNAFLDRAKRLYFDKGMSCHRIDAKLEVSSGTTSRRFRNAGIKVRTRGQARRMFNGGECMALAEEHLSGKRRTELSREYGVSLGCIDDSITRAGGVLWKAGRKAFNKDKEHEVADLCRKGLANKEIAQRFGTSTWPIQRIRKEYGIPNMHQVRREVA